MSAKDVSSLPLFVNVRIFRMIVMRYPFFVVFVIHI